MATIKSYTDISQSNKLAEILPLESTDMRYDEHILYIDGTPKVGYKKGVTDGIPCWSLAALVSVLPEGTNVSTPKPINELGYCCWNQYDEIYASNPVDACYEMVIRLNELNLL